MESTAYKDTSDMQANPLQEGDLPDLSPDTALDSFDISMLDEDACRKWILQKLHPDGAYCPNCHKKLIDDRALSNFWSGKRTHCKFCRKQFFASTGTILHKTILDIRAIYLILVLSALGLDKKNIGRILNVHKDSVRNWLNKLQQPV